MKQIKQIQVLEEGYLKLTLAGRKDFDSYMLEQINLHSHTIPCMPKRRSSTVFLYDVSERISLQRYLQLYEFQEKEALNFLIQLFEQLHELSSKLPVLIDLSYVYCDVVKKEFYGIILPIHDREVDQDLHAFLTSLMQEIHICEGEALLGKLLLITRLPIISAQDVMETLLLWKKQTSFLEQAQRTIERMQKRKEHSAANAARIQEELTRMRLLQKSQRYDQVEQTQGNRRTASSSDTVVLLPKEECNAYILDSYEARYPIQDIMLLGRGEDCHVVLSQATISLHHAKITKTSKGYELCDLSSSNGTKVNQKKCKANQAVLLKHQDRIQLADTEVQFIQEDRQ